MRKLLLATVSAMIVLTGALAVIGGHNQPARAATAYYGAGAYTGSNPIGGGNGYVSPHGYSEAGAKYVVRTAAELRSALASATSGQVIWIPSGTTITATTSEPIGTLKAGAVLASNRGSGGAAGGKLYQPNETNSFMIPIITASSNSIISGLQFQGPIGMVGMNGPGNCAIRGVTGAKRIEVENCEIGYFPCGGIYFYGGGMTWNDDGPNGRHWVHHSYIHHIQKHGYGYGICQEGPCSYLAEACHFGPCRHEVMAQANSTGLEVRYCEFEDGVYSPTYASHQVDSHGGEGASSPTACKHMSVHHNTFSKNVTNEVKPNVCIRGTVPYGAEIHHNWTKKLYNGQSGAFSETYPNGAFTVWGGATGTLASYGVSVYDNWYGPTAPPSAPSANRAPVMTAIGAKSVAAGSTLSFTVSATDFDGDSLTYSASGLPSGATFSASSRTFSWTPASGQAGTYDGIRFAVSDGSLSDYEEITITVTAVAAGINPDVNRDGAVNSLDMIRVGQHWAETGSRGWISEDINADGVVSVLDATVVGQHWTG